MNIFLVFFLYSFPGGGIALKTSKASKFNPLIGILHLPVYIYLLDFLFRVSKHLNTALALSLIFYSYVLFHKFSIFGKLYCLEIYPKYFCYHFHYYYPN